MRRIANWRRDKLSGAAAKAILPPLPGNQEPGHVPGFLCPPSTHSMSALPPKADIQVVESVTAANDPKLTLDFSYPVLDLMSVHDLKKEVVS